MFLDYSKLPFDQYGRPEKPELILKTMADKSIGMLPGVHNLKFHIKLSEPSEMTFDISSKLDDADDNPYYEDVCGYRIIYTNHYGVYLTMNPETESDGIEDVKHVTGYSREKELESKQFFLEEGTFKFYNILNQYDADTIMGRILEIAVGWSVKYVSPSVASRYRTFDQYDDNLLSFMYNTAPEKFRCVFVFEPYGKTISVYDADEERPMLPIYLDFDNLVKSVEVTEKSDELVTALRPYGADELDIRAVNPIGTNWLYDLSYFIDIGDVPQSLAEKWETWQHTVLSNQMYYKGLAGLQASVTARQLVTQAQLADLQGELDSLISQQSVTIQALAIETTDAGKQYQQNLLNTINSDITTKNSEISAKQAELSTITSELTAYSDRIQTVVDELAIQNYFTADEYTTLTHYFIESDLTEETFVATDLDTSISGSLFSLKNATVNIAGASISRVDLSTQFSKTMYVLASGTFAITANKTLSGDVIRGTLEISDSNKFVLSMYTGKIAVDSTTAPAGMVTISGTLSGLTSDVSAVTIDEVKTYEGTTLRFSCSSGDLYLTADINDYQKYSVQMELYDYAADKLSELASPTYEFEIDSGNFLFAREFEPYRNSLELGNAVYLNLGHGEVIKPLVIEVEFEFEDWSKFSLIFSNRFKRHDPCNTLKDMIDASYRSSRSIDASKHLYNQAASETSMATDFINSSLEAAKNTIIAAANQSIVINGNGINIGGDGQYQMRLIDRMLAITDNNWQNARVAIGLFETPSNGTYFGVNADVIAGKLIVGTEMIIDTANGHFRVDDSGVYIDSLKFYITHGGTTSTTTLADALQDLSNSMGTLDDTIKEFYSNGYLTSSKLKGTIDALQAAMKSSNGNVLFDNDGIWLMNGTTKANTTQAVWMNERGILFGSGAASSDPGSTWSNWTTAINHAGITADALAGKTVSGLKVYGGELHIGPDGSGNYYFNVDSNGNLTARSGTFSGTLSSPSLKGSLQATDNDSWLIGCGINVGNGNFYVDTSGNVNILGNLTLSNGAINWNNLNVSTRNAISDAQTTASDAYTLAYNNQLPSYITSTKITSTTIESPTISGGTIKAGKYYNLNGDAYLEVAGNYGDLTLYDNRGNDVFKIQDMASYANFSSYGNIFLVASGVINQVSAQGTWNFSGATTTGLYLRFT